MILYYVVIDDSMGVFDCENDGCDNEGWFLLFTEEQVKKLDILSVERAMQALDEDHGKLICGSCFAPLKHKARNLSGYGVDQSEEAIKLADQLGLVIPTEHPKTYMSGICYVLKGDMEKIEEFMKDNFKREKNIESETFYIPYVTQTAEETFDIISSLYRKSGGDEFKFRRLLIQSKDVRLRRISQYSTEVLYRFCKELDK